MLADASLDPRTRPRPGRSPRPCRSCRRSALARRRPRGTDAARSGVRRQRELRDCHCAPGILQEQKLSASSKVSKRADGQGWPRRWATYVATPNWIAVREHRWTSNHELIPGKRRYALHCYGRPELGLDSGGSAPLPPRVQVAGCLHSSAWTRGLRPERPERRVQCPPKRLTA
jgi:hypothetical protein